MARSDKRMRPRYEFDFHRRVSALADKEPYARCLDSKEAVSLAIDAKRKAMA
jgi:hypothetical protein